MWTLLALFLLSFSGCAWNLREASPKYLAEEWSAYADDTLKLGHPPSYRVRVYSMYPEVHWYIQDPLRGTLNILNYRKNENTSLRERFLEARGAAGSAFKDIEPVEAALPNSNCLTFKLSRTRHAVCEDFSGGIFELESVAAEGPLGGRHEADFFRFLHGLEFNLSSDRKRESLSGWEKYNDGVVGFFHPPGWEVRYTIAGHAPFWSVGRFSITMKDEKRPLLETYQTYRDNLPPAHIGNWPRPAKVVFKDTDCLRFEGDEFHAAHCYTKDGRYFQARSEKPRNIDDSGDFDRFLKSIRFH